MHTAIDHGSSDVVRTLLQSGIDPNAGGHMLPVVSEAAQQNSPTNIDGMTKYYTNMFKESSQDGEDQIIVVNDFRAISKQHSTIGIYYLFSTEN